MKTYKYYTHWHFMERRRRRKGSLADLLVDYPFTFRFIGEQNDQHLLPSYEVVNQMCQGGGTDGGMSPGATWKGFSITREEYDAVVEQFKQWQPDKYYRGDHPYAPFKVYFDDELNQKYPVAEDWKRAFILKYQGLDYINRFAFLDIDYKVFAGEELLGTGEFTGFTNGTPPFWAFRFTPAHNRINELFSEATKEDVCAKHYWAESLGDKVIWRTTTDPHRIQLEDYGLQLLPAIEIYYSDEEKVLVVATDEAATSHPERSDPSP